MCPSTTRELHGDIISRQYVYRRKPVVSATSPTGPSSCTTEIMKEIIGCGLGLQA
jgi:hypothetical protein